MSHNAHYVIVKATDIDSAKYKAEQLVTDCSKSDDVWANTRTVIDLDSVTETDRTYLEKELEVLNEQISEQKADTIKERIEYFNSLPESSMNYYMISQHYKTLSELQNHKGHEPYTVENIKNINNYFGYEFDEYGITNVEDYVSDETAKIFFVELDVHS